MSASVPRWDIFCSVVDHYGDVGVAWRLARQVAHEHGLAVRLFVDNLPLLARLAPEIDAAKGAQSVRGVDVCRWDGPRGEQASAPGEVVIEAFGCGLSAGYLAAMAARDRPPLWVNLEYLSAEAWIDAGHGLASRHPTLPLTRYFFFPGFTGASGGLLREQDLFRRRDRFRADPLTRAGWWRTLGLAPPSSETLVVSLFCYPSAPLAPLLEAWADSAQALLCVVPEGTASASLERWAGGDALQRGRPVIRGRLALATVPFLPQDDYDRLLWACEVNFVRGEDSFVRGQWAARPLLWQAYPQAEAAHQLKLAAFVARYGAGLEAEALVAWRMLVQAWNGEGDAAAAWQPFANLRSRLSAHAESWAAECARVPDLASTLVKFCADRV